MTKTERSYSQKNSAHRELVSALARLMRISNTYKLLAVPSPTVLVKRPLLHMSGPCMHGMQTRLNSCVGRRGGAAWLQANQLKRACPKGKWQGPYPSPSAQSSLPSLQCRCFLPPPPGPPYLPLLLDHLSPLPEETLCPTSSIAAALHVRCSATLHPSGQLLSRPYASMWSYLPLKLWMSRTSTAVDLL